MAASLGAAAGMGSFLQPALARQLEKKQKRVLMIYMAGGLSQLESWDPKPGTDTGGPFRAIPTSVPGIHISELLPYTAQQMHRISIVRGVNTNENDHGLGSYIIHTGRKKDPANEYPHLGSVMAKCLTEESDPLPGYIHVAGGSGLSPGDAAYLGPKYASVLLGGGQPPPYSVRPEAMTEATDQSRNMLRQKANDRFARRRRTAETVAYASSYDRAAELMKQRDIFDSSKESPQDQDRYGSHEFGKHCLLARRLLENGISFVKLTHSNYDTHNENFDFHLEQLGEFDRPFATLIADLADRGLLEDTLVLVNSEFGRTPGINLYCGRDHWGQAWSVVVGGCGIQNGGAYGKTNSNGTAVADGEVNGAQLFHTYLQAVGVDSQQTFDVGGRPLPMADPAFGPIKSILA
jgi:uncharacterized protein (DUF1501 family)